MAKNKILIVDDDEAIRKSLEEALVAAGFEVSSAADGVAGLERALNENPQLILADLKMPLLDGMSMITEIRKANEWGKNVPVIILTNYDSDEKTMQGIVKNEPSFYFLKSKVNPSIIVDTIKEKLNASAHGE